MSKFYTKPATLGHLRYGVALLALIAGSMAPVVPAQAVTNVGNPVWNPRASEKLIKLPSTVFKKSIDHDFRESGLGIAIRSLEDDERLKVKTLIDLRNAIDSAEGEIQIELRHQLLAEKRAYVELVAQKNDLQKKHIRTKQKLFERMLKSMGERQASLTPARRELIQRQEAAQARFKSSFDNVDAVIFKTVIGRESKYTVKYAENAAAIEKLYARIQNHRMNTDVQVEGQEVTKSEYVRHLLTESQADMALLKQEETILGYMAKNVAFDALALSEVTLDAELADSDHPGETAPEKPIDIFLSN
ncbi:MAG: hypothetical protein VYE18_04860 [Pseudomonadota bacterium]|nr:hypothetical protein [Pseudomonadota bacterium]